MQAGKDREIELKFLITPDGLSQVENLPALKAASGLAGPEKLAATYFDTPAQDLQKNGFVLRMRQAGDRFVETIKQDASSFIARGEWEHETPSAILDLDHAETTPLAKLITKRRIETALGPAFTVDVQRRSFTLTRDGAEIEAVIDVGHIASKHGKLAVCELELELEAGDSVALFDLARILVIDAPLQLSFISKAERGFRLVRGTWGYSAKGSKPKLSAEMTCREAFQTISRACLHDLMLNSAAFEGSDNVEGVHQARVATRRLRAALTMFQAMIRDDAYEALSGELKWLAGLLGTARDLDVMQLEGPDASSGPPAEPGTGIASEVEARRASAHQAVRDGFASARYRTFLVDLVAWIETGAWQARFADRADARVASFVTDRLRKLRKRLVAVGQDLARLDPDTRHRIRIRAKKLRYMAEFFFDIRKIATRRQAYKILLEALEDLQQALGEMHDIEVRDAFLAGEAVPGQGNGRGEVAAGYVVAAATDTSRELARAIDAYGRVVSASPF